MLTEALVWFGLAMAVIVVGGGFIKIGEWLYFRTKRVPRVQRVEARQRMSLARCVLDLLM